jgi:hypothetical protein
MKIQHQGFQATGMTGNVSADIQDDGTYTQITLTGIGDSRSFDLIGLKDFIDDLEQIRGLAQQVDRTNGPNREGPE